MDVHTRDNSVLIGTVAHELRTPLNSIVGWIAVLESGHADANVTATALRSMSASARTLSRLVEDLADAARTRGEMQLRMGPVNVRRVTETAVDIIRPLADAARLTLSLELTDLPCVVHGDADRLQQVFSNVLANAVKFTSDGGIRVRLVRDESGVEVRVTDSGAGIPPDFLPYAFEPFKQAQPSTSPKPGFGLGLAICRQIVEAHRGSISVTSSGLEQGTSVVVRLPAQ